MSEYASMGFPPEQAPDHLRIPADQVAEPSLAASRAILQIEEIILGIALSRPSDFAQGVVNALRDQLGLTAATLFIRTRGLQAFKLKAASGFDYEHYESFLLPDPSYPSMACSSDSRTILVAPSPLDPLIYRNYHLLDGKDVGALIVVPFYPPERSDTDYPNPLGALCLYPKDSDDLDDLVTVCSSLERLIGTLYIASLERLCADLRAQAVQAAAFESSLSGVAKALIRKLLGGPGGPGVAEP